MFKSQTGDFLSLFQMADISLLNQSVILVRVPLRKPALDETAWSCTSFKRESNLH